MKASKRYDGRHAHLEIPGAFEPTASNNDEEDGEAEICSRDEEGGMLR